MCCCVDSSWLLQQAATSVVDLCARLLELLAHLGHAGLQQEDA
jgi:hypothetical protein